MFVAKLVRNFVPDILKAQLPARHSRLPLVALHSTLTLMAHKTQRVRTYICMRTCINPPILPSIHPFILTIHPSSPTHATQAVVRDLPGTPNLTITLTIGGKQRNLDRLKTEPLEKPLSRLQKSAAAPRQVDKKQKRKNNNNNDNREGPSTTGSSPATDTIFVGLHDGPTADHPLVDPLKTANADAWRHGRLLRIGSSSFLVHVNPPTVERVDTHGTPFVGIPVVAVPKLLFAKVDDCRWRWWKRKVSTSREAEEWVVIPEAVTAGYVPTEEDVGCVLRVECVPTRRSDSASPTATEVCVGEAGEGVSNGPVQPVPPLLPALHRSHLTPHRPRPPSFRVVTYNILADQYASTDVAKNQLFASCPTECLDPGYRRPLVLSELLSYNADVICLQEVDDKMFTQLLDPGLRLYGFEGVYTNKAGKVREGSAMFWRKDRFQLVSHRDVALKDLFPKTTSEQDIHAARHGPAFEAMFKSSPALCVALQKVATIAQIALLVPRHSPFNEQQQLDGPLCVVNTHLFFHYAAPHIRTMHVWAILQEAHLAITDTALTPSLTSSSSSGDGRPALVFCGDLNSDLNDGIPGAIELLSTGRLSCTHWDWAFGVNFAWERDDGDGDNDGDGGEVEKMVRTEVEGLRPESKEGGGVVAGVSLSSPFSLSPADGLRSNVTNYVNGYEGLLDYVFYDTERIAVEQVIPVPESSTLGGFIPNRQYPSDHVAVIADLRFSSSSSGGTRGNSSSSSPPYGDPPPPPGSKGHVLPATLYNVGAAVSILGSTESRERGGGGGVIAVPTDTIYGLAACANDDAAVERIYKVKGRAAHKPLAICVAEYEDIEKYVHTGHLPKGLIQELLPGRVTMLLERKQDAPLSPSLNPGVSTLGVRIPDCAFIRAVCRQRQSALALTSANVSGQQSCVAVEEFTSKVPPPETVTLPRLSFRAPPL